MAKNFKGHNPEWTIDAAVEFIELNKDKPFYLYYATTLLHGPNTEWSKSLAKPEMTGEGKLKGYKSKYSTRATVMERIKKAGLTENEAGYTWMDDGIGILLDKLDELGIADNTVFVFVADHGSTRKGSLMKDRGMEVPLLVRWPSGIEKGSVSHELVQSTDFVPTWFELAGAKVDRQYKVDGVSMVPLFKNPNQPIRDYVYGEMGAARSVKTKDWNYVALRYTQEQVAGIRNKSKGHIKTALGLSGGVARAQFQTYGVDLDQLYKMTAENEGENNLASSMEQKPVLEKLKGYLKQELAKFKRPYGEFIPGANAVPIEDQRGVDKILKKNTTILFEERKKSKKAKK
jgi:arylsulfatase A-like enzyme